MPIIDKGLLFNAISDQLDITPSMYKLALDRVESVKSCLMAGGIPADFYLQGSFRYGTVIRPLRHGTEGSYDVDVVCQIKKEKLTVEPARIKNMVGDVLKKDGTYSQILDDEGRRCWTLEYAEQGSVGFHIDILPSVPEESRIIAELMQRYLVDPAYASSAIAITDRTDRGYSWSPSNPAGFGIWFDNVNRPFFSKLVASERQVIYQRNQALFKSPDDVPAPLVRTPLQRVIQILKRHRDIRFSGQSNEDEKPISMIITTLVSQIVKNENCTTTDTYALLSFVVERLAFYSGLLRDVQGPAAKYANAVIHRDASSGQWFIPNPVDPKENFANRWYEDDNKRAKAFFQWVTWAKTDLVDALQNSGFDIDSFKKVFGDTIVESAKKVYQDNVKPVPPVIITAPPKPYGKI